MTKPVHCCVDDPPHSYKCEGTFICPECKREVGWCMGATDEWEDLCDDCAFKHAEETDET